jgi:hypothetical protein
MRKDLETSSQLFASYLHQDWVDEFETEEAAIRAMIVSEPKDALAKASRELRQFAFCASQRK